MFFVSDSPYRSNRDAVNSNSLVNAACRDELGRSEDDRAVPDFLAYLESTK
jgi:hypothetical protein